MTESCECKGIRLFTRVVDITLDSLESPPGDPLISKRAYDTAKETYEHILNQANQSKNKAMRKQASKILDTMRSGLANYAQQGVLALEVVRDSIHKSPVLQQLLVCGGPYKSEEKRKEAAKTIGECCNIIAETDDDIHPILNKLSQELGCSERELTQQERLARLQEKLKKREVYGE
jgi:AraC-like DNA-binding protein